MTSTRDNPRLPQSTAGLTSLGAVGGARGTAAGGLRIFVEFFTTYDPTAIKSLEKDLNKMDRVAAQQHGKDIARARRLHNTQQQLNTIQLAYKHKLDAATRKLWREEDGLQGARTKADKARRTVVHGQLETLMRAQGLGDREIAQIQQRYTLQRRVRTLTDQVDKAEERSKQRTQSRLATEHQMTKLQQVRANLAPKLAGLAIGAVGGILGGAVLAVGWQLADKAISAVGDKLHDLIDPARHAREEVEGIGKAINALTQGGKLTQLEAARQYVAMSGIGRGMGPYEVDAVVNLAKELAGRQLVIDALNEQIRLLDVKKHKEKLDSEELKVAIELVRQRAILEGTLTTRREATGTMNPYGQPMTALVEYVNGIKLETVAKQELDFITNQLTDSQYRTAEAARYAGARAAEAAALWSIYAQSLSDAIQAAGALQSESIDNKIRGLGDGTSARTRRLQARVDAPRGGGGDGGARARNLANIAEERALLLLKMRLKLLGTAINLEKYSGKFLLVAINAKIAALQKEGDEQAKVNRLLDLRYRQSQTINRQEGESISDFLARRAQEQRNLLSEEADLRRQNQIDALEERKSNLEDQLALEALAERKRDAMRKTSTASHNSNLAKQLAASKKADAKALEDKKRALEKQKKEQEKAVNEAIELTSDQSMAETRLAIRGMKTLEDVNKFGGRMAGLLRAKATIQALSDGFGLPKQIAAGLLARLQGMINAADAAMDAAERARAGPGGRIRYAKGGVFELKNSSSPFGQNVRVGEEGSEIGVVLSNKVAQILKQNQGQTGQIGPFIIQQSNDPFRDRSRFGRLVRENVEAALR